ASPAAEATASIAEAASAAAPEPSATTVTAEQASTPPSNGLSTAPSSTASARSSTASAPASAEAAPMQSALDLLLDWKVAGGLGALVLGALAFSRRRRSDVPPGPTATASDETTAMATADTLPSEQTTQELPLAPAGTPDTNDWEIATPRPAEQTDEWEAPTAANLMPTPGLTAATLASVPGAAMTREFHITQQFQPSAERVVALSSPEEIVQQARTHYMEDNDVFKAIDLLEHAISARSDSVRPWQALFAIYRRENMAERYQRLALAYRDAFGENASWPAICALGRQMTPNLLDGAATDDKSIGDDLVERWLGVPLDFTAHLLANELHAQLMDTYSGGKRRKRRTDSSPRS